METELLKLFQSKKIYDSFLSLLNTQQLQSDTNKLLDLYREYYDSYNEDIDRAKFTSLCLTGKSQDETDKINAVLDNIEATAVTATAEVILEDLATKTLAEDVSVIAESIIKQDGSYGKDALIQSMDWYTDNIDKLSASHAPTTTDLSTLLNTVTKDGYSLGLSILNKAIGTIKKGDTFMVAANVESGKTTFLATLAFHLASQLKQDETLLFLNNEESTAKVTIRCFQSAIGLKMEDILANQSAMDTRFKNWNSKVKIQSIHGMTTHQIEGILNREKPAILILDQLYNVVVKTNHNTNETLRLGALYGWFRKIAAKYDIPAITAHQLGASAEGEKWPTMNDISQSKVEIAKHLDTIIMLGKSYEDGMANKRFISFAKNKSAGGKDFDPAYRYAKMEIPVDFEKARYLDP